MKKLLPIIFILLFAGNAWGAAEVFYACSGGDGTLPESQVCATAWDLPDVRSPANWTSTDADDGLIGPTEDILLLDTNDDPIKVGGRGFDFIPRIGPPFRPTIKWVDYTILYDLFVYLHLTEDLSDSQGELADGTFARASASTYIDPDTGLLTMAHADRAQIIDTTTGQNPTSADAWWTKVNVTIDDSGGLVADAATDEVHQITKYPATDSANTVYMLSAKVKKGVLDWARLQIYNATDGTNRVDFDLTNGVTGAVSGDDMHSYSMSDIDEDGYYRIWITLTITVNTTTYYISALEGAEDDSYADTNFASGNPLIYIKEIMLEEVPSDLALWPELITNGGFEDVTGDDFASWTETVGADGVITSEETIVHGGTTSAKVERGTNATYVYQGSIPVTALKYYEFKGWSYADGSSPPELRIYDASNADILKQIYASSAAEWSESTHYFQAPSGCSLITLYGLANANGQVAYFDDYTLKEIPAAVMYNALGPELVSSFTNHATAGLKFETLTSSGNVISSAINNTGYGFAYTNNVFSASTSYLITATLAMNSGNEPFIYSSWSQNINNIGALIATIGELSEGINTFVITTGANDTHLWVKASESGASDFALTLSVKEIGQFISPSDYINSATIPAEPRFEADGLAFMGASVLNLLPYSEDFSEFGLVGITATLNTIGPDGIYSAYSVTGASADNDRVWTILPASETNGKTFTASFWARGSGTIKFSAIGNGGVYPTYFSLSSINLTSTWTRYSATGVKTDDDYDLLFWVHSMVGDTVQLFGANLTPTAYLAPYIPSHGAPTAIAAESLLTANTANLLNVVDIGEGDATSEGTLTTEITFGFSYTDLSGDVALLSLNDGTAFLYCDNAGNIEATDGTNTVNVDIDFAAGDTITVVLTWSATGDSIRMGILESSSWTWDGGSTAYDDDWTNGTNLNIGHEVAFPFHIKDLKFYSRALSPIVFDATYVAGMYITTDGDFYVTADGDYYLPAN